MILYWSTIIISSFLQSTILSIDLVSVLVLWMLFTWPVPPAWIHAWLAGLIIDLVAGQTLGLTSLLYLIAAMILWAYRRKYFAFHPAFLFLYTGSTLIAVKWLISYQFAWKPAVFWGIVFILLRRFMLEKQRDISKLKV